MRERPLTVIKGYVHTLRRAEDDPVKAGRLDVINGECERLAYLVEDLLELSRAQAGELRVSAETFPLRDCVEEVAERLRGVAEQRQVSIDLAWTGNGSLVMGDENRMRQIFIKRTSVQHPQAPTTRHSPARREQMTLATDTLTQGG
jgi:signal transduction histidine kinase